MQLERAFRDFIEVHEIDNQSFYTIRNYRRYIGAFLKWLQSEHTIVDTDDLRVSHLRGWINHLQKTPNGRGRAFKDSTINLYAVNMLSFCHWLEFERIVSEDITSRFKLPRVEKEYIPTFTPQEVERLFDACEDSTSGVTSLVRKALTARNRAILAVLIDAGLRRSELLGLRLCDVDRDLRLLIVHRKGNKWQQVPISRDGFKYLHEYLTKYRKLLAAVVGKNVARKDDAVFLARSGEPITVHTIDKLFDRLQERTGIEGKRVSPHNCRRYMATTQLAMGRSPLDVQRQMGHTSLTMTNHYASLTVEHIQKSHEQFSPLRAKQAAASEGVGTGYWDE